MNGDPVVVVAVKTPPGALALQVMVGCGLSGLPLPSFATAVNVWLPPRYTVGVGGWTSMAASADRSLTSKSLGNT